MAMNSQHVTGFVIGLGAAAAGFYLYKKNQKQVDDWLRKQGIHLPASAGGDYDSMTIEELVRAKEDLEDLIAEREYEAEQQTAEAEETAVRPKRPAGAKRKRGGGKGRQRKAARA